MNDRHPTELLSAYLDGEVTTAERLEVTRHLDSCEACRALLDDFRALARAASEESPPSAPDGMAARIVAFLEPRARAPRRAFFHWLPLPLAIAAALFLVVTSSWVLLRRQTRQTPVTVAQAGRESRPPQRPAPDEPAGELRPAAPPVAGAKTAPPTGPAATAPRIEAGADRDEGAARSLHSLGHAGSVREKGAGAAPEVADTMPAQRAPVPSAPAPGPAPPPPPAEEGGSAAEVERERVPAYARAVTERAERSIVFERDGVKGALTEAGLLTLVLERGTCSVDLSSASASGEDVRSIFRLASAASAPRFTVRADDAQGAAPVPEAGAPAASKVGAAPEATPEEAAQERQEERAGKPVRLIRLFQPMPGSLEAAQARQVEVRLQRLLDVTAREILESRCGGEPPRAPREE